MEPVKLKTFYDLLLEGKTVAQLATAVETHGVTGWDRFGRFGVFSPPHKSGGADEALDALARYQEKEERYYETREATGAGSSWYDATPVTGLLEDLPLTAGIHRFGWTAEKIPSFDQPESYPPVPRLSNTTSHPRDALLILGAVLDYLAKRPKPPSQAQIIEEICIHHPEVYGLKVATLEKWFAEAKRAFKERISPNKKHPS